MYDTNIELVCLIRYYYLTYFYECYRKSFLAVVKKLLFQASG